MNDGFVPSIFRRFDSLLSDAYHRYPGNSYLGLDFGSLNIKNKGDCYELAMPLPGCEEEDVKVEVKDGVLTIKAEAEKSKEREEKEQYLLREFSYSSVTRSFTLPREVEAEKIEAKMEKGILYVNLPKSEKISQAKKIEVKKKSK